MGYDQRMYIVERSTMGTCNHTALIDDKVFSIFKNDHADESPFIYFPDHNTRTLVPSNVIVKYGKFMSVLGMIELYKCDYDFKHDSVCKFEESDGDYMYDTNGNDLIGLDAYGDYRRFVPIDKMIELIEKCNSEDCYRRYEIALAFLRSVKTHFTSDVGCVIYGH